MNRMALLFLILSFLFFLNSPVLADEMSYCHDPDTEAEWQELSVKYRGDLRVQTMHALQIGLCAKIDMGHLTVRQATSIFESLRAAMVDQAFQDQVLKGLNADAVL